jgi:hypothetical protein
MFNANDILSKGKELKDIAEVGEGLIGAVGLIKALAEALEGRALEKQSDKLLLRIQALVVVRKELGADEILDSQISHTRAEFGIVLQKLKERKLRTARLRFIRSVFLLYKPPSKPAWIPHVLCWLAALAIPIYVFTSWKGSRVSLIVGATLHLGIVFAMREWGLEELKPSPRIFPKREPLSMFPKRDPLLWLAVLYWLPGLVLSLLSLVAIFHGEGWEHLLVLLFGVSLFGCGRTIINWANSGSPYATNPARKPISVLLFPALLTALAFGWL